MEDGNGAYPSFIAGGVGYNYVVIGVKTSYGKGFDFYVQIFGLPPVEPVKEPEIVVCEPLFICHKFQSWLFLRT